jgi:hypothetical protein
MNAPGTLDYWMAGLLEKPGTRPAGHPANPQSANPMIHSSIP